MGSAVAKKIEEVSNLLFISLFLSLNYVLITFLWYYTSPLLVVDVHFDGLVELYQDEPLVEELGVISVLKN